MFALFSQFNGTLEWLKTRLTEEGFGFRTSASLPCFCKDFRKLLTLAYARAVNGSMPLKQRAKAIDAFQNDPPTTVRAAEAAYACIQLYSHSLFSNARFSVCRCFCFQVR